MVGHFQLRSECINILQCKRELSVTVYIATYMYIGSTIAGYYRVIVQIHSSQDDVALSTL